jgi:hypothetical protein
LGRVQQKLKNWRQNPFFWWGLGYLQTASAQLLFLAPFGESTFKRCSEETELLTALSQVAIIESAT